MGPDVKPRRSLSDLTDRELMESSIKVSTQVLIELQKITALIDRLKLPSWLVKH